MCRLAIVICTLVLALGAGRALAQEDVVEAALGRVRTLLGQADDANEAAQIPRARALALEGIQLGLALAEARPSLEVSELLQLLGNAARTAGALEQARDAHAEGLKLMQDLPGAEARAVHHAQGRLALTLLYMERSAQAAALQEQVLAFYEETLPPDDADLAEARNNLALMLGSLGDDRRARVLQEAALRVDEQNYPPDHHDLLLSKGNLATILARLGDLAGARALEEEVLAGYERTLPEGHIQILRARHNLAATHYRSGDFAAARSLQESVLRGYERSLPADHPHRQRAAASLALTVGTMGDSDLEQALLAGIVEDMEQRLPPDHLELLHNRVQVAMSLLEAGEVTEARERMEAVLEVAEASLADHPRVVGWRRAMALVLSEAGELVAARALLDRVLEEHADDVEEMSAWLLTVQAHQVAIAAELGERDALSAGLPELRRHAMAYLRGSLTLSPREAIERGVFVQTALEELLAYNRLDGVEPVDVFELIETRRHLSLPAGPGGSLTPELVEKRRLASAVRKEIHDTVTGTVGSLAGDALRGRLDGLTRERDRLEAELRAALAASGAFTDVVRSEDVAAALRPGEAAVGFLKYQRRGPGVVAASGPSELLAHVVRPDGLVRRVELGPMDRLERALGDSRGGVLAGALRGGPMPAREPETEVGVSVREALLDPVLAAATVDGNAPTRLYLCADDVVHLVPLEALSMGTGHVGDALRIVNLLSFASLVAPPAPSRAPPGFVALGGVAYGRPARASARAGAASDRSPGSTFVPLPQTGVEARALGRVFEQVWESEPVLLLEGAASKSALRRAVSGARYVHIATHGWFAPDSLVSVGDAPVEAGGWRARSVQDTVVGLAPMTLCGLALAGANEGRDSVGRVPGILTAEELSALDLGDCELAVLSACETGLGVGRAGQGLQSLQAALHAGGARTTITSLWRVPDDPTRRLMERFYENLWVEGLPKAEALWRAKAALRDAGAPFRDWAGWVLTGVPD